MAEKDFVTIADLRFTKLARPTMEIAESFSKWEGDPELVPFIRPHSNKQALMRTEPVTVADLVRRLQQHHIYLIYWRGNLVGEMDFQVDPPHLYKQETGSAWIGINIGEANGRGRGIGLYAFQYLEEQVKLAGLKRMELGVFEFNAPAIRLYQKAGFREIARIDGFTFWQDKMWQDIRMEKYI